MNAELMIPVLASLMQEAPPLAGSPAPTATAVQPGATAPAGAPPKGGFDPMLLIVVVMVAVMIGTTVWGQRRERKKHQALMNTLKKHDRVLTNAGIIGAIIEIKPDVVVLKIDETSNTRLTVMRSHVAQILESSSTPAA